MKAGKPMVRVARLAAALAAAGLAGMAARAETVPTPPRMDLTRFVAPKGFTAGTGIDMNNLGQVIARTGNAEGEERALVWDADGSVWRVSTGVFIAGRLNDQGLALVQGSDGGQYAWRGDGSLVQISAGGSVQGLNNLGEVVGTDTATGRCGQSYRWSLNLGTQCQAEFVYGIADSGHMLGLSGPAPTLIDPSGGHLVLPMPSGRSASPAALSGNARFVLAATGVGLSGNTALRWEGQALSVLPSLGGANTFGTALNDAGAVVGRAADAAGTARPVLWDASGRVTDVSRWFAQPVSLVDVNNRGQLLMNVEGGGVQRVTLHPDWAGASGAWDDARQWSFGGAGAVATGVSEVHDAVIAPAQAVTVTGGADARARSLFVGGNLAAPVSFDLHGGRTWTLQNQLFLAGSEVRGSGILATSEAGMVHIDAGARARVGGGERLVVDSPLFGIAGQVRVQGTALQAAQLQSGPFTSIASVGQLHLAQADAVFLGSNAEQLAVVNDGQITVQDSALSVGGAGLKNGAGAQFAFSFGRSWMEGRLFNENGASTVVSNGAQASFFGPVQNDGELRVSSGGAANFFGLVSGSGFFSGAGEMRFEGGLAVGASPGKVLVTPGAAFGAASQVLMELGGTRAGFGAGHHDKIVFDGSVVLEGGVLDVAWWGGFEGAAGDRFDLFDWNGGLSGSFGSVRMPTLAADLAWDLGDLYAGGSVAITAVPEPVPWALWAAGLVLLGLRGRRS